MNKVKISLFALAAIFAVSCVQDPAMEESAGVDAQANVYKKIVNSSEGAVNGELILYVSEETADAWANAEVATRSGIESLDALASELDAENIFPVFNMAINTEAKRALGMHRWFVVKFDQEADVEAVAMKYASLSEVTRVEYSTLVARPQVQAHPVQEVAATRSDAEMPFNDPQLPLQWHYNNEGLKSIYPESVEGEDINLFDAWNYTTGNSEIIVAVVDEGVKYNHPDLADNMWTNDRELNGTPGVDDDGNGVIDDIYGVNAVKQSGNITWDKGEWITSGGTREWDGDSGHGTHVAGTIAAVNNNGKGVAGVAGGSGKGDGVRIMSIQIFDGASNSTKYTTAWGIEYAADNGASILQNSWGYTLREGATMTDAGYASVYSLELTALRYFVNTSNCSAMTGSVAIFAAGNATKASSDYPGAYNEFISVTATAPDGLPTSYTNYKFGCNVAAPGGDWSIVNGAYKYEGCVLSTLPRETIDYATNAPYGQDYGYMQGTSMACPHVSGIAALVLSYAVENGIKITNTQLYDIITSSVRNIDNDLTGTKTIYYGKPMDMSLLPYKGNMGTGRIDALMAIMNVRGAMCVPVTVGEEFELKVKNYIGNGDIDVKANNGYIISDETKSRLGIDKVEFFSTSLYFTCQKPGIGVITVKYIAGGDAVGGGESTGGKLMEKQIVIVAREKNDNGGWL